MLHCAKGVGHADQSVPGRDLISSLLLEVLGGLTERSSRGNPDGHDRTHAILKQSSSFFGRVEPSFATGKIGGAIGRDRSAR